MKQRNQRRKQKKKLKEAVTLIKILSFILYKKQNQEKVIMKDQTSHSSCRSKIGLVVSTARRPTWAVA